jgi:hypothetical protein
MKKTTADNRQTIVGNLPTGRISTTINQCAQRSIGAQCYHNRKRQRYDFTVQWYNGELLTKIKFVKFLCGASPPTNIKFHQNPSSRSAGRTYGTRDERTFICNQSTINFILIFHRPVNVTTRRDGLLGPYASRQLTPLGGLHDHRRSPITFEDWHINPAVSSFSGDQHTHKNRDV